MNPQLIMDPTWPKVPSKWIFNPKRWSKPVNRRVQKFELVGLATIPPVR
jgi:hypothetical protein